MENDAIVLEGFTFDDPIIEVPLVEVVPLVEGATAPVHLVPALLAGANRVLINGRWYTRLRRDGEVEGYSIQCPTCGIHKNLNYIRSGSMSDAEAWKRLAKWADSCRDNHRAFGGRLLVQCKD